MILDAQMRALAAERAALGPTDPAVLASASRFQNTPFTLARVPLLVDRAAVDAARPRVETYVTVLDKLLEAWLDDAETRAWFDLGPDAEALIRAEDRGRARVRVCRLDGYVDAATGTLRILENNADAPAGTLHTPRLNAFCADTWGAVGEPRLPMERRGDPFVDYLMTAAPEPFIVVVQLGDKAHNESNQLVATLSARGAAVALADPRQLTAGAQGFELDGRPIDVIWNKINAVPWAALLQRTPALVPTFCRALSRGGTLHVNGFSARYIAEAKTALAAVQRPAFLDRLTPAQRDAVRTLLPRTRRLDPGPVLTDALANREALVLKERYDIRGDGVSVGRALTDEVWRARVAAAVGSGAVVQDYVEPHRAPILYDGAPHAVDQRHSLDWFLFDGALVGLGSKASEGYRVNLFQGGTKLAVAQV
ncbi:MAG: hypothetical protein H6739_23615 [Alphaproteobacteria bacterium]|nr:hypothetical protein [Alphaproteobacteria bacterium]